MFFILSKKSDKINHIQTSAEKHLQATDTSESIS